MKYYKVVNIRPRAESVPYRISPIALRRDERLDTAVDKSQIKSERALVSNESRLITWLQIGKFVCLMKYTLKQIAGFATDSTDEFKNGIRRGGMLTLGPVEST